MPEDLRAHIRYPEEFFSIQAGKYALFHMTDPRVFYNKEDLWRVAQSAARGAAAPMTPYFTIMKLAEVGEREEFILMVPFTPARKNNMIAWMAARCDGPLRQGAGLYLPQAKAGVWAAADRIAHRPGPRNLAGTHPLGAGRLDRDPRHVAGVPVLNSVLYVEPLYLAAEAGGGLPQLKRVIVAYSDHVVMEDTLDAALSRIFSGAVTTTRHPLRLRPRRAAPTERTGCHCVDTQALIREANQHYQRALQLQRQGDWAGYGDEVKKLGDLLNRLASTPQAAGTRSVMALASLLVATFSSSMLPPSGLRPAVYLLPSSTLSSSVAPSTASPSFTAPLLQPTFNPESDTYTSPEGKVLA